MIHISLITHYVFCQKRVHYLNNETEKEIRLYLRHVKWEKGRSMTFGARTRALGPHCLGLNSRACSVTVGK